MITRSVIEAAQYLKAGQVLAYPTEAVWGLGCDPDNEQAFSEILRLKQRPIEKGVILLAANVSQVEHLLQHLEPAMRQQVIKSWNQRSSEQRAVTWLLEADQNIPQWIRGQHTKVAVRIKSLCVLIFWIHCSNCCCCGAL